MAGLRLGCIHGRAEAAGIEPKTPAKMVKTLHKVTVKMDEMTKSI
jgi:hypothetical protein